MDEKSGYVLGAIAAAGVIGGLGYLLLHKSQSPPLGPNLTIQSVDSMSYGDTVNIDIVLMDGSTPIVGTYISIFAYRPDTSIGFNGYMATDENGIVSFPLTPDRLGTYTITATTVGELQLDASKELEVLGTYQA
jgi:hypothetical protein